MKASEISSLVEAYGVVGLYGKSENELREFICTLVAEHKDTERRYLSATSLFSETFSRTEWAIADFETQMRSVWITKSVTTLVGTEFEKTTKEHVMLVDRTIAPQMVALLNSQRAPSAT